MSEKHTRKNGGTKLRGIIGGKAADAAVHNPMLEARRKALSDEYHGMIQARAQHEQIVRVLTMRIAAMDGRYAEVCEMLGVKADTNGGYPLLAPTQPAPQPAATAAQNAETQPADAPPTPTARA